MVTGDSARGVSREGAVYFKRQENGDRVALSAETGALAVLDQHTFEQGSFRDDPEYRENFFSRPELECRGVGFSLEVTTACNLACAYCYQSPWLTRTLTPDLLEQALTAMRLQIDRHEPERVDLLIIGGEPSLVPGIVRETVEGFAAMVPCDYSVLVDTNGVRELESLLTLGENVRCKVPLTLPRDHDRFRSLHGKGTAEGIAGVIGTLPASAAGRVELRYNAHGGNIDDFAEYLDWVDTFRGEAVSNVVPVHVKDHEYNPSLNSEYSAAKFDRWLGSEGLTLLARHGWGLPYQVFGAGRCSAYMPGSFKMYAQGEVTVCDSMYAEDARITIADIVDSADALEAAYREVKAASPWGECGECALKRACSGRLICEGKECSFPAGGPRDMVIRGLLDLPLDQLVSLMSS